MIKPGMGESRDVPGAELGSPPIDDVGAMMRAASDYAVANGLASAFPPFNRADLGAGVVYGLVAIYAGNSDWRDALIPDLYLLPPKDERTAVILCQFRNADGFLVSRCSPGRFLRCVLLWHWQRRAPWFLRGRNARTCQSGGTTVDDGYQDFNCIMSYATNGSRFSVTTLGVTMEAGPGLNGAYTNMLGGIPPSRIVTVPGVGAGQTITLAPTRDFVIDVDTTCSGATSSGS